MMMLAGKLTIGFLQEDNPVKAFFRIRPVHTPDETTGCAIEDIEKNYPENGYIRIVPDKNELSQFRVRMRELGRIAALDLRKYPGENEKIRPNKNYGIGPEKNAMIVYSDAICQIAQDVACQVIDAQYVFLSDEVTLRIETPGTKYVLLKREGQLSGPWIWTHANDVTGCITLKQSSEYPMRAVAQANIDDKLIELKDPDGEAVTLMMDPTAFGIEALIEEKIQIPAGETVPSENNTPDDTAQNTAETAAEKTIENNPVTLEKRPEPAIEAEKIQSEPAPSQPPVQEKSWMQRTEMPEYPRAVSGRMNMRDQVLRAQSGINPRRGRSLSEVVDEQWRKSRYDQLGHPVPAMATGHPVISPIEQVERAVKEAWKLPDARSGVLKSILKDESVREAICECLKLHVSAQINTPDEHIQALEVDRLKLVTEIDALRIKRADMKSALMDELRKTHAREIEKYEQTEAALRAEVKRNEEAARRAQLAAEAASGQLKKTAEQVEEQMLSHLMASRAIELAMHATEQGSEPAMHPNLYEPSAGALISDLRVQLESAGFTLNNDDAVGLLAAMMTGGLLIVSGASGSGKSQLVRQLAAALGLTGPAKRFAEARSVDDPEVKELIKNCDGLTPSILLVDDVNLEDNDDAVNGAIRLQEEAKAKGMPLCIVLTVQDMPDGKPLSARLLGRAFFIRLDPASKTARWKPPELLPPSPDHAVKLSAIQSALMPVDELEAEVESRLIRLRAELEKIGYIIDRRTLNELWRYCASVVKVGRVTGMDALDNALSMRALPAMLAAMDIEQLTQLPQIFGDLPECMKLMEQPLPLPPL